MQPMVAVVANNLRSARLLRRTSRSVGDEGQDEAHVPTTLAETKEQARLSCEAAIGGGAQSTSAAPDERSETLGVLSR